MSLDTQEKPGNDGRSETSYTRLLEKLLFSPVLDQDFHVAEGRVRDLLVRRHNDWLLRVVEVRRKALAFEEIVNSKSNGAEMNAAIDALFALVSASMRTDQYKKAERANELWSELQMAQVGWHSLFDEAFGIYRGAFTVFVALRKLSAPLAAGFRAAFGQPLWEKEPIPPLRELAEDAIGEASESAKVFLPFTKVVETFYHYTARKERRLDRDDEERERIELQNLFGDYYEWQSTPDGEISWEQAVKTLEDSVQALESKIKQRELESQRLISESRALIEKLGSAAPGRTVSGQSRV